MAQYPDDDKFWLVVISVACASHHTHHNGCQSCGKLSVEGNTTNMVRVMRAKLIRPIALCNWLLQPRCCYTSTDDWWDHFPSRSCSDTTCNERTSFLKSCRFHFLCNPVQMHTSLFGSILLDKTLGNTCKQRIRVEQNKSKFAVCYHFWHRLLLEAVNVKKTSKNYNFIIF